MKEDIDVDVNDVNDVNNVNDIHDINDVNNDDEAEVFIAKWNAK